MCILRWSKLTAQPSGWCRTYKAKEQNAWLRANEKALKSWPNWTNEFLTQAGFDYSKWRTYLTLNLQYAYLPNILYTHAYVL